jgi:hypothetical protein
MAEKILRIFLKDYDPATEMLVLEDYNGKLSPLVISITVFNRWRIDEHKNNGSRIQMYMTLIKKQGGKQTIIEQVNDRKKSSYYTIRESL